MVLSATIKQYTPAKKTEVGIMMILDRCTRRVAPSSAEKISEVRDKKSSTQC